MSCVIYRRQSLDKSGDELGIERQLKECKRVAKMRSHTVAEVITDNSVSASKRGRPGYDRLVKMVAAGHVDTIIILRIDRLLRLNDELEELIQLVEIKGLRVITAEGDIDLSTYQGRLMARILVSVARAEMEVKSQRHKLANQQKAEKGLPHGARRAYGYHQDGVTILEDEALVLKEIAYKFLSGWSYKELAYYLNEQGITTAQGKLFYPITVRNMLQRKRYASIREYDGVEYPAMWPPIFDADTWSRIQFTVKARKDKAGHPARSSKYLLTGFLICGKCGTYLNGETKRDNPSRPLRRVYICRVQGDTGKRRGCGGVTRNADAMEHFIRELIVYRLDTPDLGRLIEGQEKSSVAALLSRKEALEAKLTSLLEDYTDETLTKLEYKRAKMRVQSHLGDVAEQIASLHQTSIMDDLATGESVCDRWNTETDGWKRQLIGLLIESIVVNPGLTKPMYYVDGKRMRFDPSLVEIKWKA